MVNLSHYYLPKIWREGGVITSICIAYLFSDIGEREPMIRRHENLKQTCHSLALPLTWRFQYKIISGNSVSIALLLYIDIHKVTNHKTLTEYKAK